MIYIYDLVEWNDIDVSTFKKCLKYLIIDQKLTPYELIPANSVANSNNWFIHFENVAKKHSIPFKYVLYKGIPGVLPNEINEKDITEIDFMPISYVFKWDQPKRYEFEKLYKYLMLQKAQKEEIALILRCFCLANAVSNDYLGYIKYLFLYIIRRERMQCLSNLFQLIVLFYHRDWDTG